VAGNGNGIISYYSPRRVAQRTIVTRIRQGSRLWLWIGATLWVGGVIRRAVSRQDEVAATELLKPGESIQILTIPVPSRRQQRAAARKAVGG
jgi:hypothetical protein